MMGGGYKEPPKFLFRQELRHSGDGISESLTEFANSLSDNQWDYLTSVSLSDDGSRLYCYALDDVPVKNQGAVYEFANNGDGTWTELARITSSVGENTVGIQFGAPSQRRGDYLFVGAPLEDTSGMADSGAVFVFHSSSAGWTQVQKIVGSGLNNDGSTLKFGAAISVNDDGTILVVGSPEDTGDATNLGGVRQGHAYVFQSGSSGWVQVQRISHWGETYHLQSLRDNDYFGTAVTMNSDGTRLAISAPRANLASVWIFESGSSGYEATQRIQYPPESVTNGKFGTSLAMSFDGQRLAVGQPSDSTTGANNGCIRVFDSGSAGFTLSQSIFENTVSRALGTSVAMYKKVTGGSTYHLLVGGIGHGGIQSPHYVYQDFGLGQGFQKYQELAPEAGNLWSAPCLSKDGKFMAIGKPYTAELHPGIVWDPVAGAVNVYEWSNEY